MQRAVWILWTMAWWLSTAAQTIPFVQLKTEQNQPLPPLLSALEDPMGRLWFGTEGQGVWMYTGGQVRTFTREQGLPNDFIRVLEWDAKGNLWAGTEDGIAWFDGRLWHQPAGEFPKSNRVNQLVPAPGGEVYILCREGIFVSNGEEIKPFKEKSASALGVWWNDAFWYTQGGTLISDGGKGIPLLSSSNGPTTLSALTVRHDTLFWAGTAGMGYVFQGKLQMLDAQPAGLFVASTGPLLIHRKNRLQLGLGGREVVHPEMALARGFLPLSSGTILIYGNEGAGVTPAYPVEKTEVLVAGNPVLVHAAMESPTGLLLGTDKGLVARKGDGFEVLFAGGGQVFDVLPWGDGYVLVAENGAWIWRENQPAILQKGFWLSGLVHQQKLYLVGPEGALVYAQDGNLPAKKEGAFIDAVDLSGDKVAFLTLDGKAVVIGPDGREQVFEAPDSVEVTGFALLNDFPLWATRDKGLLLNNAPWPAKQSWITHAVGMVQDAEGLWVNTGAELLYFDGNSPHHCLLVAGQGMGLGLFEGHGSPIKNPGGGIFLGLSNGFVRANQPTVSAAGVVIRSAEIFARDAGDEQEPWTFLPANRNLGFQENYLRFGFAAVGVSQVEPTRFYYRLHPLDKDWSVSTSGEVLYPNLPAGTFTLEVAKADAAGMPGEVKTFSFSITPPFWKRFWFWFLVLSLIFLGIYFYFKSRLEAVEIRASLERDLAEMERKALGLQMSPHFIFNALDSISSFIFKNDPQSAVKYLTSFAKLMRATLEASREHLIPLQTEVSILQNYLALENLRFSESIHFEVSIPDEVLLEGRIPPMLVQPLVENAVKHGLRGLSYPPVLSISFERMGDALQIVVEDNGRGRQAAEERDKEGHRSVGTNILQRRLSLIGQTLGGEAVLRYEDLKNDQGEPAGTRAILKLPWVDEDWVTDEP